VGEAEVMRPVLVDLLGPVWGAGCSLAVLRSMRSPLCPETLTSTLFSKWRQPSEAPAFLVGKAGGCGADYPTP